MKMRRLFAAATLLAGLAGGPALAQAPFTYPPFPHPPFPSPAPAPLFRVCGLVGSTPTPWSKPIDMAALLKLPAVTRTFTYSAGGGSTTETYTGVLLSDLLQSLGGIPDNPSPPGNAHNDILRKVIVVTGSDGYAAAFTAGEIDPGFGGNVDAAFGAHQVIVAYANNGQPLAPASEEGDGPTRIVAPGDKKGGRFVSNIVSIAVTDPTMGWAAPPPFCLY